MKDIRANAVLIAASVGLCCVLYPAVLWAFAQTVVPTRANGSLVTKADGSVVGSTQVAQAFTGDGYFWPRPSAAGYNAAAAGGSNWGASNPKLRDRAARQLGPLVRYKSGALVAPDVEAWVAAAPDRAAAVKPGTVVAAEFFDAWLQDPANRSKVADIEPVPADFVMASGAGLDPHITLRNARWQLGRVAAARAGAGDAAAARARIDGILTAAAFSPLGGLAGEPLVNVLELNLRLDAVFARP
ncbi:MAG: potassium-transporting ATPase subunit C [Gemmataceae bacterium]